VDGLRDGNLSRRDFANALARAGVGLATIPLVARPGRAAEEITYYTWAEYVRPEFHQGYIDKYGGSPALATLGDEEEALQKIRGGFKPDIAHPCSYVVARWHDAGVIKPLDVSRIEHWDDIWDSLKNVPQTFAGDERWWMPWDWGNSSVIYRTDLVQDYGEDSWQILFDERYSGRLAVYDVIDGAVIVAAMVAGVADPFNMTDEEIEKTREMLRKQRPLLRFYWTDITAIEQGLASGELVAAYGWNSSVHLLKRQGIPVEYMRPKEGILTWVCGMVLIEGAEGDEQAAYDLLNAMLTPETGKVFVEEYGYGHSNRKTYDLVSGDTLAELGIAGDPEEHLNSGVFFEPIPPETREKLQAMYDEVKAGL
jgi:spermidine/putrescine transport system substrate-binding protein